MAFERPMLRLNGLCSGSIAGIGMIDIEEAKRVLAAFEREGVEYVIKLEGE